LPICRTRARGELKKLTCDVRPYGVLCINHLDASQALEVGDMDSIQIGPVMRQLTTAELLRLKLYAKLRIKAIGRKALGRDWQDLVAEGIALTASGERPWKSNVDLFSHLIDTMRSISTEWSEVAGEEYLECELMLADGSSLLERPASEPNPEKMLESKEVVEQIRQLCSGDPIASQVVELLAQDLTPAEIQQRIPVSQRQYRAAIKHIRLTLQKDFANSLLASANRFIHRAVPRSSRTQPGSTYSGFPKR
jgi:hypothetical protein